MAIQYTNSKVKSGIIERHTVPEIVHVNRIIKLFFDIIEGEVKITKSS